MSSLQFSNRVKYSFYATLVFMLLTNPIVQKCLQNIFTVEMSGTIGYFFLSFLFFCSILGLMMFPL